MDLTAEGDVPYGRPVCTSHNAADSPQSRHGGTLQGDILDERVIDVCEHPTRNLPGSIGRWLNGKPRDRVPYAVKSSRKDPSSNIANRLKAPSPVLCLACIDVIREHISAEYLPLIGIHVINLIHVHVLQLVDVMHAHIVIVRIRIGAVQLLDIPSARFCRCGMMRDIRACIVGDRLRGSYAVYGKVPRRCIGDIVADVRRILAADGDVRPRERRAVCVRHSIRVEDGDVLALDVEFRRLDRTEVQHVAHLCARGERTRAVCLERLRRCGNISGIRRREVECARIDLRILSKEDAVRVDEVDVPTALDRAIDVRRALARDEVQIVARLTAAVKAYLLARVDGEVLPAEDIVRGLARDVHDRAARGDIRLGLVRRCVRALDGQRIRRLRGKGDGDDACKERTEDGAVQVLRRCCFHIASSFLFCNNASICARC